MVAFAVAALVPVLALFGYWTVEYRRHRARLNQFAVRIHVNGIRGKSTVTRLIAAVLREADVVSFGKTTGTAAKLIDSSGVDRPIFRRGAATILEQISIIGKRVTPDSKGLVIECMALRPQYQAIAETMIVQSNIGVITNVREDHQDIMGETLPEIASALLSTCPRNGALVTAEQSPEIQRIMQEHAERLGSTLVVADPGWVTDEDIARFPYIAFRDNVAIALAIAFLIGIPRARAMDAMIGAQPDPGVLRLTERAIGGKHVTWANLFAVNDRESAILATSIVRVHADARTAVVGILNNRADRERRAIQFADIVAQDIQFDRVATLGALEGVVVDRLVKGGYESDRIICLGESHDPTVDEMLQRLVVDLPHPRILLVGLVNIHTHAAELLVERLEQAEGAEHLPFELELLPAA